MLNSEENNIEVKEETMPKKKGVKVKRHKRRKPDGVRKTVDVKGYTRSPPQKGVKKYKPKYKVRKKQR